eukprot:gene7971-1187_t
MLETENATDAKSGQEGRGAKWYVTEKDLDFYKENVDASGSLWTKLSPTSSPTKHGAEFSLLLAATRQQLRHGTKSDPTTAKEATL